MFFRGPVYVFFAESLCFYCDMDAFSLSFLFHYYPMRVSMFCEVKISDGWVISSFLSWSVVSGA